MLASSTALIPVIIRGGLKQDLEGTESWNFDHYVYVVKQQYLCLLHQMDCIMLHGYAG